MKRRYRLLYFIPLLLILYLLLDQYVFYTKAVFPPVTVFSGKSIYNPYAQLDTSDAVVANFHAHAKAWGGLTNGKGSAQDIWRRYDSMGYAFHGVSQYFNIDTFNHRAINYVPVYEHGINLRKTHQLVMGATSVAWKDFIFPQTLDNKQFIINKIAQDPHALIVLNHPNMLNGYQVDEMKKLYNYDLIEILNPQAQSLPHWDAALSSGRAVFGIANDDVHNVLKNSLISRFYTIVYGSASEAEGLYNALKLGSHISVWAPKVAADDLAAKKRKIESAKKLLLSVKVLNETVHIQFSKAIDTIQLIGNNGKCLGMERMKNAISYQFTPSDTYMRVEFVIEDGSRFYMNPFFRY